MAFRALSELMRALPSKPSRPPSHPLPSHPPPKIKPQRYWDLRQPTPAFTYQLSERLYALDVKHPLLVAATADRQLFVFNLQNPQQPYKTVASPLKWQTRVVSVGRGWGGGAWRAGIIQQPTHTASTHHQHAHTTNTPPRSPASPTRPATSWDPSRAAWRSTTLRTAWGSRRTSRSSATGVGSSRSRGREDAGGC